MTDLDQGGRGFQKSRVYLGPSLGWTEEQLLPETSITTTGTYAVKAGDSFLLVNVAGAITIQLPNVIEWVKQTANQPATGFGRQITIKDIGGNASNFPITVTPFGTQKIDGLAQPVSLTASRATMSFIPLIDLSGWCVQASFVGAVPPGGGDVFKAGDNTFTGLNIFNGSVQAQTAPSVDNSQNVATTAFVKSLGYVNTSQLNAYATLESPSFTGTPRAPTPGNAINDSTIATTAYVKSNLAQYQPLDDDLTAISALTGANVIYYRSGVGAWTPVTIGANMSFVGGILSSTGGGGGGDVTQSGNNTFTGVNAFNGSTTAVTVTNTDNSTKVATTAYVKSQNYLTATALTPYATLNNPTFTGDPQAPTPLLSDSDTSIATTGFVKGVVSGYQLADGDLTALSGLTGTNTIYYRSGPDVWTPVTIGSNMTFAGGTLNATAPSGTVNSSGGGYSTSVLVGYADTTGNVIRSINLGTGLSISGTTINLDGDLVSLAGLSITNAMFYRSAADTWSPVTIGSGLTFSGGTLTASATGGGNVSNIGTPTAGQYARWTNGTTIQGVAPSVVLTDIGAQPLDGDLTAIAALTGTNTIYYRSGTDTWAPVVMGAGMTFSGGTLSSAGGLADAPSDGKTYGRKSAAWTDLSLAYVLKAGDTMTGGLVINSAVQYENLKLGGVTIPGIKWTPSAGATSVGWMYQTANTLYISGDTPIALQADLTTGVVTFPSGPVMPTQTPGDSSTKGATTAFVTAAIAASGGGATISDSPPAISQGKLWWESDTGILWMGYNDGNSTQWVAVAGAPVASGFSTGDAKLTLKNIADPGWIIMDDGYIGDALSAASTRANADCQALFTLLWNNISDTWAPVSGGRGADATSDWNAHKVIRLTRQLGRSLTVGGAGSGLSSYTLGSYGGAETHTQDTNELASHSHFAAGYYYCVTLGSVAQPGGGLFGADTYLGATSATGSNVPANILNPRSYWNVMIKL